MGRKVFNGDPDAEVGTPEKKRYEDGVRAGSLGLAWMSIVTIVFSPVLPYLMHWISIRWVFVSSNLILFGLLFSTWFVRSNAAGQLLFALLGLPWAVTMVVPYALLARVTDCEQQGVSIGT
jgi:Na+/melibiose symporter-like transporter